MIIEKVIFIIAFIICSSVICLRLINDMKKETHKEQGQFIQLLIKINIIIQAIGWPIMMLLVIGFIFIHQNYLWIVVKHDSLRYIALYLCRPLVAYFRAYVSFHTLVIAVCRYGFIVQDSKVSEFGIGKFKKIVSVLCFAMPFVLVLLAIMSGGHEGAVTNVLVHAYKQHSEPRGNITSKSLIYPSMSPAILAQLDPVDYFIDTNFPVELTYFLGILAIVLLVAMASNLIEGGMYYLIFRHFRRYGVELHTFTDTTYDFNTLIESVAI